MRRAHYTGAHAAKAPAKAPAEKARERKKPSTKRRAASPPSTAEELSRSFTIVRTIPAVEEPPARPRTAAPTKPRRRRRLPRGLIFFFAAIASALLLAALHDPVAYTPIEISRAALLSSIDHLAPALPEVEMLPVCADFTRPVAVPMPEREPARRLLFFPGSTLGNFEGEDAVALLRAMRQTMGRDGLALVGIDLHKDPALIEAAYNDAQGVTAAFTLNLLARLNREIGSDFDLDGFRHRARYSSARLRIETDLVSQRAQDVHLDGRIFHFAAGEPIRVEYSHKYTDDSFDALLRQAGLQVAQRWDAESPAYGLRLLRRA